MVEAVLVLEDGTTYIGESFGAEGVAIGEVVFNTSMMGYQEILTDPSYAGQIVLLTYPIIGNYGISREDLESRNIQATGLIVREAAIQPSHNRSVATVGEFLQRQGTPGISGIDTRALTRRIRTKGVMMGALGVGLPVEEVRKRLEHSTRYDSQDFVDKVTTIRPFNGRDDDEPGPHIVLMDFGLKFNIVRELENLGCRTTVVPATTLAEDIRALKPDGLLFSPGPGDPLLLDHVVREVRSLVGHYPALGICLGHQMVARALGATTYKLKFGHRGGNHPVMDLDTKLVTITAQNHGYAVNADSLRGGARVKQINLNDNTVEGLAHDSYPLLSIQYHAEASPGPRDNSRLFSDFLNLVKGTE